MRCNLDTNNSNLSFGRICAFGDVQKMLGKSLNPTEMDSLKKLIKEQKKNPVIITLANHTETRLNGRIFFEETLNGTEFKRNYIQFKPFESYLKFIERLCKKADYINKHMGEYIQDLGPSQNDLKL